MQLTAPLLFRGGGRESPGRKANGLVTDRWRCKLRRDVHCPSHSISRVIAKDTIVLRSPHAPRPCANRGAVPIHGSLSAAGLLVVLDPMNSIDASTPARSCCGTIFIHNSATAIHAIAPCSASFAFHSEHPGSSVLESSTAARYSNRSLISVRDRRPVTDQIQICIIHLSPPDLSLRCLSFFITSPARLAISPRRGASCCSCAFHCSGSRTSR